MPLTSRAGLVVIAILQCFSWLRFARGSVYITHPYQGITCSGGSECIATWADDGLTPLLAEVGSSDFALYQGTNSLVQQLAAGIDVSQTRELTFIPNPNAGPNADSYWIKLTSLSAKDPNDTSQPYTSFSGQFTLDNMSGVEGSQVTSLTSSLTSSTQTQPSSSTNGVVSTTSLSGVIPTGSASTLSSAISALSAISSAESGLLTSSSGATSSTTRSGSATGTSSGPSGTSTSSSSRSLGSNDHLMSSRELGVALALVLLASQYSAGFL